MLYIMGGGWVKKYGREWGVGLRRERSAERSGEWGVGHS